MLSSLVERKPPLFNQKRVTDSIKSYLERILVEPDPRDCGYGFALVGGKRMGKTRILLYLHDQYLQDIGREHEINYIPVYYSYSNEKQVRLFYRNLMRRIIYALEIHNDKFRSRPNEWFDQYSLNKDGDNEQTFADLQRDLVTLLLQTSKHKFAIVLLIDNLYENDSIQQQVLQHWIEFVDSSQIDLRDICLIVADKPRSPDRILEYWHFYQEEYLKRFPIGEIGPFAQHILDINSPSTVQVSETTINLIDEHSSGFPGVIHHIIQHMYTMKSQVIHDKDLRVVCEREHLAIHSFHQDILANDHVVSIVEKLVDSPRSLRELCDLCPKISPSMYKLVRNLMACGLIYETEDMRFKLNVVKGGLYWSTVAHIAESRAEEEAAVSSSKLTRSDKRNLIRVINKHPEWRPLNAQQRIIYLRSINIPDTIVDNCPFNGTTADTRLLLDALPIDIHIREEPQYTALGLLLEELLESSPDNEGAHFLAQTILNYRLVTDSEVSKQWGIVYSPETGLNWSTPTPNFRWYGPTDPNALERIWSRRAPFYDVVFLEQGIKVARATGRVEYTTHTPIGTGFLVGPDLLLTNHHVLPADADLRQRQVRFGYRINMQGLLQKSETCALDAIVAHSPATELDFTLVRLQSAPGNNPEIGYLPLLDTRLLEDGPLYIIQHPAGEPQKIVLQDNWTTYVAPDYRRVHYLTNTRGGSSGSPVCNEQWQVVALHHSGSPYPPLPETTNLRGNEGIPIRAILPLIQEFLPVRNG